MEKVNIAEILKDCPRGMELDCMIFNDATLYGIDTSPENEYPIRIETKSGNFLNLTKYGTYLDVEESKCVIYPKGKTTWEGFQRPFKDGDIIADEHGNIAIYKGTMWYNNKLANFYCGYRKIDNKFIPEPKRDGNFGLIEELHYATEKEKQKLFDTIKDNGYKWNSETKTLEKLPKFKVGDKIRHKSTKFYCTLRDYSEGISAYYTDIGLSLTHKDLEDWELAPNKFDVTTLKPFDEVLVRSHNSDIWECDFFSLYNPECSNRFHCVGAWYDICIPYIGNEHLRGTTNDCDEYYKTWE